MPVRPQPARTEQPHRKHGLFSDHFLNATLPERPDWQSLAEEARPVMQEIARLFDAYVPSQNEAQTEQSLVRPVLHALGHTYEVQPALSTPQGTKRPDYVFYRDEASLATNRNSTLGDALLAGRAFAAGDAKYWDRPLDVTIKGSKDSLTNNPAVQISFYMQHAGTQWGILTNGRLWRLYHRDSAHKLDLFYEVDLKSLVESGDAEAFLYFYAFFGREAFEDHAFGVGEILRESEDYARSVGDTLKSQVYEALRHLAQGFLDYPANGLTTEEEDLRGIYDASLIPVRDDAQLSMLSDDAFRQSMSNAVGSIWLIEESPADSVEDVREQERLYASLRDTLTRRYARLADLATATRFGVEVDARLWNALADYATKTSVAALPQFEGWLQQAESVAAERRFFHWELEFPEVFFDRRGEPRRENGAASAGFDAVVGNPPYVRQEALGPYKPYFAADYPETYHGVADLYVYFIEAGFRNLRPSGRLAYISSNGWLRANYAGPLRAFLRQQTTVESLIDLGDNRVFRDAPDLYPAILIVRRESPPENHEAQVAVFNRDEGLADFEERVEGKLTRTPIHDQPDTGWQLGDPAGRRVFSKLMSAGKPLGEVVNGQFFFDIKTGFNEAFIVDRTTRDRLVEEDPKSAEIIKPMVQGQDLRPWYQEDEGRWLIVLKSSRDHSWPWSEAGDTAEETFQQTYPSLHSRMKPLEDRLRKRQDKGLFWWELRRCDYYAAFEKSKILWPDIAKFPRFSWDEDIKYPEATAFCMPSNDPYLVGIMQSQAAWFCISNLCHHLGERAGMVRYRLKSQYMTNLLIPDASDDERETIGALAERITSESRARYSLHERTRRRILSDLGAEGRKLNQKLTAWWELDFPAFRAEVKKVFKRDIPLAERDDWEDWLQERRARHERHTAEIVPLETELNERVYELFDLGPDEIRIIEESTKYRYGEV